jgi:hypothetical protein
VAYLPKYLVSPALVVAVALGGCGGSSPSEANELTSIRGVRYCEVIAVTNEGGLHADVYGTQGLSDCPLSQWEALDPDAIQEELNALQILMNGPRFWLIDSVTTFSELGEIRFLGELQMRLLASVALSPGELNQGPYQERSVVRDTEFLFVAGSEVYELIAPGSKVYVMQSYAHIVDDTLNEAALPGLGEELDLPEGWTYRTRVLDEDYVVVDQDGIATVVQDELQNTYQFAGLVE